MGWNHQLDENNPFLVDHCWEHAEKLIVNPHFLWLTRSITPQSRCCPDDARFCLGIVPTLEGTSTLPLLFCKVPCQNLQQVVAAWSLLQPRAFAVEDGFAVARGTREASVLLDLDGCVAKVIFVLAPLQHIQPDLGTVHRWADVLGLLDSPRRVSVSALHRGIGIGAVVTMLRMVSAMLSLYLAAQYFLRYGPPVELPAALGQLLVFDINSTQSQIEDEDFTDFMPWWPWLHGIIYSIPYFVLAALLSYDTCRCRNASTRKKPTQEVYDRYFGLRGSHYTWKVAILQCFTVCLQTLGKMLGARISS